MRLFAKMKLPGFWMDTYEVTNREFKKFVDGGGDQEPYQFAGVNAKGPLARTATTASGASSE
jgi:formylglycine-generating enzyme required for sulfatase activity